MPNSTPVGTPLSRAYFNFSPTFECEGRMDRERWVANNFFFGRGGGSLLPPSG